MRAALELRQLAKGGSCPTRRFTLAGENGTFAPLQPFPAVCGAIIEPLRSTHSRPPASNSAAISSCPRPWENASEEVATRCSSQGVGAETAVEDCREWLDRGDQVLSAAI